jgi:hypothetical protein
MHGPAPSANYAGLTRLSAGKQTLAAEIARQATWLTTEGKARGHADIDQQTEQNYPLFENLAALWRQRTPSDNGLLQSRGECPYPKAVNAWQNAMSKAPDFNFPLAPAVMSGSVCLSSVIMTTGDNDGRVDSAQSRKMIARLQAANLQIGIQRQGAPSILVL